MMRDWLARANRSYRNEIVKPLLEPAQPATPSETVQQPPGSVTAEEQIKREAEAEAASVAGESEARQAEETAVEAAEAVAVEEQAAEEQAADDQEARLEADGVESEEADAADGESDLESE